VLQKPPLAERERWLRSDLATLLFGWARASRQGAVAEGVRCIVAGSVYVPDIVYLTPPRLAAREGAPGAALAVPPDLAVEICPAAIDPAWAAHRVALYVASGTPLAWLVDAGQESLTVYAATREPRTLVRGEILEAEDVLPGFYVHLDDLFETLLGDERESV
jgi:Uma2 family endonuclease